MKLNDWLRDSAREVSSALVRGSEKSLSDSAVLSVTTRTQIIDVLGALRSLMLPGVYEQRPVSLAMLEAVLDSQLKQTAIALSDIIGNVLRHSCEDNAALSPADCADMADQITIRILTGLPVIRGQLDTDIRAAFEGDPAAKSFEEIMLSYPSLEAVSIYRIAHLIHTLGVPVIPRIMTEYAHKNTGIDIHPGATIGNSFFIDHGTGVVIGETCTIGCLVKLYQGVTLGAKSFPLDEHGNPIKGIKRHPNIEDGVVIYSGATILGDITIGHHSVIGGNVWLTESVPPYSTVFNTQPSPAIKTK
jgi:serine O-acetyltransferase